MFQEFRSTFFSELFEHNVGVMSAISPNGVNFAYSFQCQLKILDIGTQEIMHTFICEYPIDCFGWSKDSELVFCCMKKQGCIQTWNLMNPEWRCKIIENPLAIEEVYWAPDCRHLLVISEFHLKMTVWSMVSSAIAVIENPKHIKNCVSFSSCERYMAVAQRRKHKDSISIYTCNTWEILECFPVETKDLAGIFFSPSDLVIGVLEACTEEPKVMFYSIDARILGNYGRFSTFGFTCFSWSRDGKLIAVGDNFRVTILSSFDYKEIFSWEESESIDCNNTTVYEINPKSTDHESTKEASSNLEICQVLKGKPFLLESLAKQAEKYKSKRAKYQIKTLSFSHCGKYLLLLNDFFPKVMFVFDLSTFKLSSVVSHYHKIKDVSWHSKDPLLAVCCGSRNVNLWAPTCCISLWSPFRSSFVSAEWCPGKSYLLLKGRSHSALLYS